MRTWLRYSFSQRVLLLFCEMLLTSVQVKTQKRVALPTEQSDFKTIIALGLYVKVQLILWAKSWGSSASRNSFSTSSFSSLEVLGSSARYQHMYPFPGSVNDTNTSTNKETLKGCMLIYPLEAYLSATLRYFGDFLELPLSCTWLGGPPPCSTCKRDRSSRFPARKTRSMTEDKKKILKHRLTCQNSEFISGVSNFETSLSCIEHGVQRFWGFLNFPPKYPKLIT